MTASISVLPESDQPLSEQFRIVSKRWADAENAARILEEMKTVTLEQRKNNFIGLHGDMPDAKVERTVKADPEWEKYIQKMCAARTKANLLRQQLEYIRMKFSEQQSMEASARHEMRLSR